MITVLMLLREKVLNQLPFKQRCIKRVLVKLPKKHDNLDKFPKVLLYFEGVVHIPVACKKVHRC